MSRHNHQRLVDILAAADAIADHLARGELTDGLVSDAVRVRLIEIGEAVKGIAPELLAQEPDIPWRDITDMRNYLAHRYFDTAHGIVLRHCHRRPTTSGCRCSTTPQHKCTVIPS